MKYFLYKSIWEPSENIFENTMTKILGCFTLKYTKPQLPWEIQSMIVNYLQSTQLEYILKKYPNKNWDWDWLSYYIKFRFVAKHPDKPWNWEHLSKSSNIDVEEIIDLEEFLFYLPKNPSFQLTHILEYPDRWNWSIISETPNITMKTVIDNPNFPWCMYGLGANPSITMEDIKNNDFDWDWMGISRNPNITIEFIKENNELLVPRNKRWGYRSLSKNPNLTMKFIIENIDENWNWHKLSKNSSITMDDIINNPDLPWEWEYVSLNPNITPRIFDLKVNWLYLGENPNITMEYIIKYKEKWEYYHLSGNPNLTLKFIEENKERNWDITKLILNLNLTTKEKLIICEKID